MVKFIIHLDLPVERMIELIQDISTVKFKLDELDIDALTDTELLHVERLYKIRPTAFNLAKKAEEVYDFYLYLQGFLTCNNWSISVNPKEKFVPTRDTFYTQQKLIRQALSKLNANPTVHGVASLLFQLSIPPTSPAYAHFEISSIAIKPSMKSFRRKRKEPQMSLPGDIVPDNEEGERERKYPA